MYSFMSSNIIKDLCTALRTQGWFLDAEKVEEVSCASIKERDEEDAKRDEEEGDNSSDKPSSHQPTPHMPPLRPSTHLKMIMIIRVLLQISAPSSKPCLIWICGGLPVRAACLPSLPPPPCRPPLRSQLRSFFKW